VTTVRSQLAIFQGENRTKGALKINLLVAMEGEDSNNMQPFAVFGPGRDLTTLRITNKIELPAVFMQTIAALSGGIFLRTRESFYFFRGLFSAGVSPLAPHASTAAVSLKENYDHVEFFNAVANILGGRPLKRIRGLPGEISSSPLELFRAYCCVFRGSAIQKLRVIRPFSAGRVLDEAGGYGDLLALPAALAPGSGAKKSVFKTNNQISSLVDVDTSILARKKIRERGLALEERALMLNLTGAFFKVFGIFYDIHYLPFPRLFTSEPRMQDMASCAAEYLHKYVTHSGKSLLWLNDFIVLYYASIFTKSVDALVKFMAYRFRSEYG
jgi:hypothetical protein